MPFLKKKYKLNRDPFYYDEFTEEEYIEHGCFQDPSSIYGDWISCREEWANHYHDESLKRFYFSCKKTEARRIAYFINMVENQIARNKGGITSISRSKFGYTNCSDAIWVEPLPFWNANEMRRSLFTALLRCARNYKNKKGFDKALFSKNYTKKTKNAVKLFLKGYTTIKEDTDIEEEARWDDWDGNFGWTSNFSTLTTKECKEILKKSGK